MPCYLRTAKAILDHKETLQTEGTDYIAAVWMAGKSFAMLAMMFHCNLSSRR